MLLKKKENQETGGDTDETGAKTEKTHNFLLCDCADRHSAVKSSAAACKWGSPVPPHHTSKRGLRDSARNCA